MKESAEKIVSTLGPTGRLTTLTGAGVSAESGIPTFRDMGGLWHQYSLEDVATPEGFARNPELVIDFYNERRMKLMEAQPNPGHEALARLEEAMGERFTLITQNIDDLHERAGSRRVLHMHGELLKVRCVGCAAVTECRTEITLADSCGHCGERLRPHVVWFGEIPFYLEREIPTALRAEVFMSIGTSGTVYPAAGFVYEAKTAGRFTVELNKEPSDNHELFDLQLLGAAGEQLPELVGEMLDLM